MSNSVSLPSQQEIGIVDIANVQPVHHRGGDLRVAITPKSVGSQHHIMGQVVLAPGESVAEHAHDYGEESIFVVEGSGVFVGGGQEYQLVPGRGLYTPRGVLHSVTNTGADPLVLVFASAPLAPSPEAGHRDTQRAEQGSGISARLDTCDYVPVAEDVQLFSRQSGPHTIEPILFLHGNRDNHTHFAELQANLSRSHQTLAIDLRGHGFSSKIDCPLSADLYADDLDAFIDYHRWDKVALVGHSLGAVTSMVYALRRPERVSRLVLMGAAAHYEMKWKRPEVTEETYPAVLRESNKRAAPFFFLDAYPAVQRRVMASWSSIVFPVHRNLIQLMHPDLRPRISSLQVPTLIIAGEMDRSTPVESARWLSENIPGARLVVIPQTGHFMFMEQPEVVGHHIQQFLQ
jgi:pimeloyl-ACP methyl ester carboxylesterase